MGRKMTKRTAYFDGMCWPRAMEPEDDSVQWRLRYGPQPPSREDVLYAASVMSAYTAIIYKTSLARAYIVRTLLDAERTNKPKPADRGKTC